MLIVLRKVQNYAGQIVISWLKARATWPKETSTKESLHQIGLSTVVRVMLFFWFTAFLYSLW